MYSFCYSDVPSIGGPLGQCSGLFEHPPPCAGAACNYHLTWNYNPERDDIDFTVTARQQVGTWTGVGFSQQATMVGGGGGGGGRILLETEERNIAIYYSIS